MVVVVQHVRPWGLKAGAFYLGPHLKIAANRIGFLSWEPRGDSGTKSVGSGLKG